MVPGYWHEAFHHLLINFNVDEGRTPRVRLFRSASPLRADIIFGRDTRGRILPCGRTRALAIGGPTAPTMISSLAKHASFGANEAKPPVFRHWPTALLFLLKKAA
jgi:hypothetical protein